MSFLKRFVSGELTGWKKHEAIWLACCLAITCSVSLLLKDSILSIAAALTGTAYTVISGKGKISCYIFGAANTVLYGIVSMQNRLWGEVILNWFWYLPMMFVGIACWKRRLNCEQTIIKTRLSRKGRVFCFLLCFAGISAGAIALRHFNDPQPFIDSLTTVLSVAAMILTVKRCSEQWMMWIIVNAASILMWFRAWLAGTGSIAVLLMWVVFLANGIIFYIKWQKETTECPEI